MRASAASKYEPLTRHLRAQVADTVRMRFSDIERVIGAKLPPSAAHNRAYWSNNTSNSVLTKAWLAAGFRSEQVDLAGRELVFRRTASRRAVTPTGFSEAPAASYPREDSMQEPSLFGCMAGTIIVKGDLTEPADPELPDYLDEAYGASA